jgi:small Trp-rich protein
MLIIVAVVALTLLKYFSVSIFANMSWWVVVGAAVFAFFWFEFFERWLGLDKRKEHDRFEKIRKERVKRTFDKTKH